MFMASPFFVNDMPKKFNYHRLIHWKFSTCILQSAWNVKESQLLKCMKYKVNERECKVDLCWNFISFTRSCLLSAAGEPDLPQIAFYWVSKRIIWNHNFTRRSSSKYGFIHYRLPIYFDISDLIFFDRNFRSSFYIHIWCAYLQQFRKPEQQQCCSVKSHTHEFSISVL